MAYYSNGRYLTQYNFDEFSKKYKPGDRAPWSGIYRCVVCGNECVHTSEKVLPPQNHHQHTPGQGPIVWHLIITDGTSA